MRYDLLQVCDLKFPGRSLHFAVDEDWKDFGGEKPVDENGEQLLAYSTMQKAARQFLNEGKLADWDGFLEILPSLKLMEFIIIHRKETTDLRLALIELLLAVERYQDIEILNPFWAELKSESLQAKLDFPVEAIAEWNERTKDFCLPDSWRFE